MTRLPHTLFTRPVGIALAVLAAAACSPGRAAAECGDYVHIVKDDPVKASTPGHGEPIAPRPPCHGPGCSEKPATPVLPLTAPVTDTEGPKELAARTPGDADPAAGPGWVVPVEPAGRPSRIPNPIFHPPRAA